MNKPLWEIFVKDNNHDVNIEYIWFRTKNNRELIFTSHGEYLMVCT